MDIDELIKQLEHWKQTVGSVKVKVWNYDNDTLLNINTMDYEDGCLQIGVDR